MFGLHTNAAVSLQAQEAQRLLDAVLLMQNRTSAGGGAGGCGGSGGDGGALVRGLDELVTDLAAEILAGLPEDLDLSEAAPGLLDGASGAAVGAACTGKGSDGRGVSSSSGGGSTRSSSGVARQPASFSVVLTQEVARCARLGGVIRASLARLQAALLGQAVMAPELEGVQAALLNGQVAGARRRHRRG